MAKKLKIKRIGVLTSGGDSAGMNAAIRAVVRSALYYGAEVMGVIKGYQGLIDDEMMLMNHRSVSNIIGRGGTILKTSRCKAFMTRAGQKQAVETLKKNEIDGLVIIGGDGSYHGAQVLERDWKFPCVGIPGTIDNDVNGTEYTLGSDTALNTALDAIDKIRDTATSLERIFVVEVMGRLCGYIALNVGLAGGAEQIVIPEEKLNVAGMCKEILDANKQGKASWIIVVAEGAMKGPEIAEKINRCTKLETRTIVLGHIQRGGSPTAKDRILGSCFGEHAVKLLLKGEHGKAVGIVGENVNAVPFSVALKKKSLHEDYIFKLIKVLQ